jgi:hypothetical protein
MRELVAEHFAVEPAEVTMETGFEEDLGADSVDLDQLVEASDHMSGGDMKNAFVKACSLACLEPEPRLSTTHLLDTIAQVKKANHDVSRTPETVAERQLTAEEINSILNK